MPVVKKGHQICMMGRSSGKRGRKMGSRRNELRDHKGMDQEKKRALEEAIRMRREKVAAKRQQRGSSNRKRNSKTVAAHRGGQSGPKISAVDELLAKAEGSFETFNFDMAKMYCQEALNNDPKNAAALEMMGNLLVEEGDIVQAKECLTKAIETQPDRGFSKYMYLGQLCEGLEAVQLYEKGIHIMEQEREKFNNKEKGAGATGSCSITNTDISQGYSTIAEIYLTDACFEENAEQRCKECIGRALEEDPRNAEAHQLMASFWLSKENKESAKASMETSLSLWVREEDENEEGDDKETKYPMTYQSRIECAKILIELEDLDRAESVLSGLLEESDIVLQVWYMLGLVQVQRDTRDSQPYARFCLNKAKKLIKTTECDDLPVVEHVNELLEKLGPGEGDEEGWLEKVQMAEDEMVEYEDNEEEDDSSDDEEEEAKETDVMEH